MQNYQAVRHHLAAGLCQRARDDLWADWRRQIERGENDLVPHIEREFGPTTLHDTRLSTKDIVDGTECQSSTRTNVPLSGPALLLFRATMGTCM